MAIQAVRAKINNEWTNLTKNPDTGRYEAELTAPPHLSINLKGGYYPVEVEAVNDAAVVTAVNDIDTVFGESLRLFVNKIFAIYDRTQADVDRAKYLNEKYLNGTITEEEKQEWESGLSGGPGLKGALNLSDFKRNENNCQIIGGLVAASVNIKEWQRGETPRVSDYTRIWENVKKISEGFLFPSIPPLPECPLNTYQKWNDMERILYEVYNIYVRQKNSYAYCGNELFAGDI